MSQPFRPSHHDPSRRTPEAVPAVTVSERVALSLRALGATGQAWLAELPDLLAGLAIDWSITIGARLDGGRAAYVAEATTYDGTPAVLKVAVPAGIEECRPFDRQLAALQLADGDPYVELIRHDVPRQALLLERLGRPMAALGWPAARQLEVLARTAARGWRPTPAHGGLPIGAGAARWHAEFIPSMWQELAGPCSQATMDLAVRCAAARSGPRVVGWRWGVAHHSRVAKVVIDVPEDVHDREVAFWQGAVGQELAQVQRFPEYHLGVLPGQDFHFLVQRLVDGVARVHLDVHTDDVEAEVSRLEGLGAERVRAVHSWWVMRDPAGLLFCVLPQRPGTLTEANARRWD